MSFRGELSGGFYKGGFNRQTKNENGNNETKSFGRGGVTLGGFGRGRAVYNRLDDGGFDGHRNSRPGGERRNDGNSNGGGFGQNRFEAPSFNSVWGASQGNEKENFKNTNANNFDSGKDVNFSQKVEPQSSNSWGFGNEQNTLSNRGFDNQQTNDRQKLQKPNASFNEFSQSNTYSANGWDDTNESVGGNKTSAFGGGMESGFGSKPGFGDMSKDIGGDFFFGSKSTSFPPKPSGAFSQSTVDDKSSAQFSNNSHDSFQRHDRGDDNGNKRSDRLGDNGGGNTGGRGDEPRPLPNNYVPAVRALEELYKEDSDHAEHYRSVADDDDEVHLSGPNILNQVVLDSWDESGFDSKLLTNIIERSKYIRPRKIQAHIIPIVLAGRDVKGHAETGSGKTAAFMLPMIHMLMNNDSLSHEILSRPSPYAIVIEPTRELCCQIYEQGRKLANDTGVFVAKAYGQYNMRENLRELNVGCSILCATPGRLNHFVQSNLISLDNLKFLVLDEADTLLEANFLNEIRELINAPNFPDKQHRQTMLFSATFPELVQQLSMDVLKDDCVMVSNQKMVATNSRVLQRFMSVCGRDKKMALLEILQDETRLAKKKNPSNPVVRRTLVFVKTKRDADLVSLFLCEKDIRATTINGDRPQNLREKALRDFRNNDVFVLVSTDVCARGLDIKDLDHVINMDLPSDAVTYVHRIGRTGRLKPGVATSFFDEFDCNDCNIAHKLVEFVLDVGQEPPEFLLKAANGGGGRNSYGGFSRSDTNEENNASGW